MRTIVFLFFVLTMVSCKYSQVDEMNAYAQANGFQSYQQMMDYVNAMNESQQVLDNSQNFINNNAQANTNMNNVAATNLFAQQPIAMPQQNNLGFNDLYVSPYQQYV